MIKEKDGDGIEYLKELFKEAENKEFNYNNNILLKYSANQETIPFEQYFKDEFDRLIKKYTLQKDLFLQKEKKDINLFDYLNKINEKDYEEQKQKEKDKQEKNIQKKEKKKEKINQIKNKNKSMEYFSYNNNINNSLYNNNNNNTNNTIILSQDNINTNKIIKTGENINNISDSNMSNILDKIQEVLDNNMKDIEELLIKKNLYLNQIIKENIIEQKKNKLIYFDDANNNISSKFFEEECSKYIFELLNFLSLEQDFEFYYNLKIPKNELDIIFNDNNLEKIPDIKFDFVVSNLQKKDFINMIIFLYPNIIYMNNIFNNEKILNFDELINLKSRYLNNNEKIDIIGEIGDNISIGDDKIQQFEKYSKFISDMEKMKSKNMIGFEELLKLLKLKKNNEKIIMFVTNGIFTDIILKKNQELLIKAKQNSEINSLIIYINKNYSSKENIIIDDLIFN